MHETPLTQEVIDNGSNDSEESSHEGLLKKAAKHPVVTGGLILAGAGLAYAIGKVAFNSNDNNVARDVHIETSIAINKTPAELYAFWRDFRNLPRFMNNLDSVTVLDSRNSHWVAKGLAGTRVEWDAEIYNEIENELIAWRSLENADVVNAGSVHFKAAPRDHGTYVEVTMNYNPPAGKFGATIAQLFGAEPKQLIKEDLRRLKQILETGEIATIAGQTTGRAELEPSAESEAPDKAVTSSENQETAATRAA